MAAGKIFKRDRSVLFNQCFYPCLVGFSVVSIGVCTIICIRASIDIILIRFGEYVV